MTNLSFTIGPDKLGRFEAKLGRQAASIMRRSLRQGGREGVRILRRISRAKRILFTGGFANGWSFRMRRTFSGVLFNRKRYAKFVEAGRKPGRPPPARKLKKWARAKLGDANAAYPVARAIGKRGIKPKRVMTSRAFKTQMRQAWRKILKKEVERAIRSSIP